MATLILPQHLWVRVYVPEPWLGYIKLGQEVRARVDSFGDEEFTGTVEQINRQAEFTPRNVQTVEDRIRQVFGVKIRLQNHDDKLRAGMSADVTFPNVPEQMNQESRNPEIPEWGAAFAGDSRDAKVAQFLVSWLRVHSCFPVSDSFPL